MRRAELTTAIILAALSIYLMWKSAELSVGWIEDEGPGGGAWPFWLSTVMLISCIWTMFNWYRRTSPPSQSTEPFLDSYATKMFVLVGGGVVAMVALVHVIGMYGAIPAFLIYYIRFLGRHSWALTLAVAITAPVVIFLFFDIVMRITLPKGYLEPLFLPLYDFFF